MSHVQLQTFDHLSKIDQTHVTDRSAIYIENVPDSLQKVVSIVCQYFPELKNEKISFLFKSIPMTMQARPNIWTVFSRKREYFVLINTQRSKNGLLVDEIPFSAQIGILAHELSHILDYKFKTNWEIIKTGLWYLKKRNQENYEKAIDYIVIKKGFGQQLRDWSYYVLNNENLTKKYKETKETYYLNPEEIDYCMDA